MLKGMSLFVASAVLFLPPALPAEPHSHEKEEANRKLIISYYNEPVEEKRLRFMADNYQQHNPTMADGKEGVRAFFRRMHKLYPNAKQNIVRIAADGDFVWVHLHTIRSPGDRGLAVINIFRIEDGKIAEHWDVAQPVPEKSANNNTMF